MDGIAFLHVISAFGVIVLLLCALAALPYYESFLRLPGAGRRLVSVVETTALANASCLHVVKILDQYYVVGSSSGQVSVLCPLPKESVEEHLVVGRIRTRVR